MEHAAAEAIDRDRFYVSMHRVWYIDIPSHIRLAVIQGALVSSLRLPFSQEGPVVPTLRAGTCHPAAHDSIHAQLLSFPQDVKP